MFIPKNKMSLLDAFIDAGLESPLGVGLDEEELQIIYQIQDQVNLCRQGDGNFLQVEVCYANKLPTVKESQ